LFRISCFGFRISPAADLKGSPSSQDMPKVVIIGAGISGLSLAYRLQQRMPEVEITVLEKLDRPGGTVWTDRRDGFQIEAGANGFLDTKPTTLALCRDLGLSDELVAASPAAGKNRYLLLDGRLRRLPTGLVSFLTSDLLSVRGKIGLLLERFRKRRTISDDESIAAFVRRRAGTEAARVFADALVTGIFAGDPELLSVRASFPRLVGLEEDYGSLLKGVAATAKQRRAEAAAQAKPYERPGRMWSFRAGLRRLIEKLRERLPRPPLLGVTVRGLSRQSGVGPRPTWVVTAEGRDSWTADVVVLTCPAYEQAALLAELDVELADRIGTIAYNRIAVVALGYRRSDVPGSLDGFGFIAPQRTRRDILGVQWCSSIFPERAPPGTVLLRAMCGGWQRPEVAGWQDSRLLEAVRAELRLALKITAAPIFHHIVRWDRAIPQYQLGHLDRVAWIEDRATRHAGLFLGGNAYHGVALNDCTEQGEIVAAKVQDYLASRSA
jgi:oxygen-dependent protoporphyrinogen oxidase